MGYSEKVARELIDGKLYWYHHTDDKDIKKIAFGEIVFVFEQLLGVKLGNDHLSLVEFFVFDKVSFDEVVAKIKEDLAKKTGV